MKLGEIIMDCLKYRDDDDYMHMVFAERANDKFHPDSRAVILKLTLEEMEMDLSEIARTKCPGFYYFLELYIIQDFFTDLVKSGLYKSDREKIDRMIYYAEFDA